MPRSRFFKAWPILAVFTAGTVAISAKDVEVDVVVDMSPEGRKVAPPTPQHPVFYLPVVGGYMERGATVAGESPPPAPIEIAHLVATTLAQQGYFVTKAKEPPSIVLSIFWGSLNPEIMNLTANDDSDAPAIGGGVNVGPPPRAFFNEDEMLALVGGGTLDNLTLNYEREHVMQGAERNRYFVVISAYDFKAYVANRQATLAAGQARGRPPKPVKKVLLWQAKMSVPANGVSLGEVIPLMIKAGGPQFGRETIRPKTTLISLPAAQVEVGTPQVKGYLSPGESPAPSKSP